MLQQIPSMVITIALLVFAAVMEAATPGLSQIVVLAVITHWLTKTPLGEAVADRVRSPKKK